MVFVHRGETAVLICLVIAAVVVISLASLQSIGQTSSMNAITGSAVAENNAPAIVQVPGTTAEQNLQPQKQEINSTLNL
ncbi:hypothetical protein KY340_05335 [Candidatus Woesearchaeota archaeon]|nr:hypothetical protein [Candidatus Woesearchaeota archaeon]